MNGSSRPTRKSPYTDKFYAGQSDRSYQSAGCVLPLVLSAVPVKSAIDVGCGVGTWASALLERGVTDVLGIDGHYVNRDLLRIPQDRFQAWDLSEPITLDRRFDLAVCLEVAEHLPASRAEGLVADLVNLAPVVLFSAAIPGQGGNNHVNERYLSYWASLFNERDYVLLDVIRPVLWSDERCDWWYRQNAVLFAHKENPASNLQVSSGIDYIHPRLHEIELEEIELSHKPTIGSLVRSFPSSLNRSLHTRRRRLLGK
jgi:SAM-dependent methyltransferase